MTQPVSPAREWRKVVILAAVLAAVAWATQAWTGRQQAALAQRLAEQAQPGDIVMLSSTTCGICTQARRWFEAERVPFEECFMERNAACAERFARLMAPGTPVIIVRGQPQLGFDPQRIAAALAAAPAAGSPR